MRGLRSTLFLLVVLIGLGAYIYFVAPQESTTEGPAQEKVFQGLEASNIQQIEVKAESGEVTTVKKDGDAWRIVNPVTAPASESEVSSITSALGAVEMIRVIEESPKDLSPYGLQPPRYEVGYTAGDGSTTGRLLVGTKTPTGAGMYAQRSGDPRVFLIAEYQDTTLNKSTFDLRDKTLLRVERDKVDAVEVNTGSGTARFARQNTDWRVTNPVEARADFGVVDGLVGRVAAAQMTSVADTDPSPAELKKFGLEPPVASVSLSTGSAKATLLVGGEAEGDTVYARDASGSTVVTIEKSLADDIKRGVDEYRRKEAFDFRAYNATRVEITRGDQTLVLERVKGQGESPDTWRRVSPNPGEPDRSKVESLLTGLADVRAVAFTPNTARTGLDRPAMSVLVKFEDGTKEERVTFGRNGGDVFFSIPGEAGAGRIEAEKFNEANQLVDELLK